MSTEIVFAKEESLHVEEDLAAVEHAIGKAPQHPSGLAKLTSHDQTVLVNPSQVRFIWERTASKARIRLL